VQENAPTEAAKILGTTLDAVRMTNVAWGESPPSNFAAREVIQFSQSMPPHL